MAVHHRICIFLTGGIGDFVSSLPALQRVRSNLPESEIVLVGNPLWLPLVPAFTGVDEALSMDDLPLHAGFRSDLPEDHPLSLFLAGFHLILSWFGDREGGWQETLRKACPGKVLVCPYHRVHAYEGHVSDYYLQTLKGLGLTGGAGNRMGKEPPGISPDRVLLGSQEGQGGSRREGRFLCIHPGSGSERKNWPKEGFLKVALGAFRRWDLPSAVLIGPAEEGQRRFWNEASGPHLSVNRGLPILEASRLLCRASLYVGNDSGITHLAAALGVPVVALFGPTDPHRWAPLGPRVRVLQQPVSPGQVLSALGGHLGSQAEP